MPFTWPLVTPFAPTGSVTQSALDLKFTEALNELYGMLLPSLGLTGDSGTQSITPTGVNVITSAAITFSKTFSAAPRVFCQFATGITSTATCFVWPTSILATGFTLNINRSTTTATSVYWFAVST